MYRLGEHKPHVQDDVIFYSKEYLDKQSLESKVSIRVVDDKSITEPTLGLRRLKIRVGGTVKLFRIKAAIYFLADLIKLAKPTTWFIDSHGRVFQHRKSTRAKLVCRKIKQVLPVAGLGCVLEVEGVNHRFKSIRRPNNGEQYAGVLQWGLGYILYGLYLDKFPDTHRLI